MWPLGDGQLPRIMPADNQARLDGATEHRREASDRPSQYRPHRGRLRTLLDRLLRR